MNEKKMKDKKHTKMFDQPNFLKSDTIWVTKFLSEYLMTFSEYRQARDISRLDYFSILSVS